MIITTFILKKNENFVVVLLILISIFSFTISSYHYGIEQGFFQESTICGVKDLTENLTKEDILKQLNEKNISCKDVTFRIFGLSLTSINIILNFFLIILLIKFFANYEKLKFKI